MVNSEWCSSTGSEYGNGEKDKRLEAGDLGLGVGVFGTLPLSHFATSY